MPFLPSVASSYGAALAQSVPGISPVARGEGRGPGPLLDSGRVPLPRKPARLSGPLSSAEPRPHFLRFPADQQPLSSLGVLFLCLPRLCYLGLPTPTAVR